MGGRIPEKHGVVCYLRRSFNCNKLSANAWIYRWTFNHIWL